jgi:N-acetylglucosaminyldiphosphoundecaprenol N-acetyl-beta-D-mannosaminyltransferase
MAAPRILGMRVDPTSYEEATEKVLAWAAAGEAATSAWPTCTW